MSAPAMTPGSRQAKACEPISIEAVSPSAPNTRSSWRSSAMYCDSTSSDPGRGHEVAGQAGVGVDRVGVGLDDVDRPRRRRRPGRPRRRCAQDVDLLAGVVVGDPRARAGQRMAAAERDRAVLGAVAADRDDLVARVVWRRRS